jgi:hypothetical protein
VGGVKVEWLGGEKLVGMGSILINGGKAKMVTKAVEKSLEAKELTVEELAQALLKLSESELETLEILLDPWAKHTIEQSLEDIKRGRTIPLEEW